MKTYWKQFIPAAVLVALVLGFVGGKSWWEAWRTYWWQSGWQAGWMAGHAAGGVKGMASWLVEGAGDATYNGTYTESGTYNGEPAYTNGTRWLAKSPDGTRWTLCTAPDYADGYLTDGATLPGNPWSVIGGTPPAPTVSGGAYTISGTALDTVNAPVPGVVITVYASGKVVDQQTTDDNGEYTTVPLEDGTYTVCPYLEGRYAHPVQATVEISGANATQDFLYGALEGHLPGDVDCVVLRVNAIGLPGGTIHVALYTMPAGAGLEGAELVATGSTVVAADAPTENVEIPLSGHITSGSAFAVGIYVTPDDAIRLRVCRAHFLWSDYRWGVQEFPSTWPSMTELRPWGWLSWVKIYGAEPITYELTEVPTLASPWVTLSYAGQWFEPAPPPQLYTISGTVKECGVTPLVHEQVRIVDTDLRETILYTDDRGAFSTKVDPGGYWIRVYEKGAIQAAAWVVVPPSAVWNVKLRCQPPPDPPPPPGPPPPPDPPNPVPPDYIGLRTERHAWQHRRPQVGG